MQVRNAAFSQLFNQVQGVGFFVRAVIDILEGTDWRNADPDAIGTPLFGDGINHFQHQTGAVLYAAAVLIGTLVRGRRQELVQQIAVGTVQLNHVETGFTGVGDGLTEIVDDARDLVQLQRARRGGIDANGMTVFIAQGGTGSCVKGRG